MRTRIDLEWYPATRLLDVTQVEGVHIQVDDAAPASLPLSNVAVSSLPAASSGTLRCNRDGEHFGSFAWQS
ncbi:MAG: hypothetical protein R3C56_09760 [Pirellulaceae bacterium]